MDLNISVGDWGPYSGKIVTDDFVEIDGKQHRRIVEEPSSNSLNPEWDTLEWIEGIGASTGLNKLVKYDEHMGFPIHTRLENPYYHLMQVKDKGKVIYDRSEILKGLGLDVSTGIHQIETDSESESAQPIYYNLQGAEVKNPGPGIYVKVADGKATKVVVR